MKIIFASKFYYRRGGLEAYLFKAKNLLEAHGHEVIPFSTNFSLNYDSEYSKYFCTYFNLSKEGFSQRPTLANFQSTVNMFFNKEAYKNMRELIEETKPDIVQGFGVTKHISYSIFKAAKDAGVPTVMRLSDFALLCPNSTAADCSGNLCPEITCSKQNFKNILQKKCIHNSKAASLIGALEVNFHLFFRTFNKYVDYFIAPSRFLRDTMIRHFGISQDRIIYLPIFEDAAENLTETSDEGYFVFAGRLSDEKGVLTLLKALRKTPKQKLIIAGTGPAEEKYKEYVQKNKLNVVFVGHIDYERLKDIIKKCNAVIIPSECYENSPNIILEAYSYGRPAIGSRIGGIPELIDDNKTGFLFEPGNVEQLIARMRSLNDNRMLASEMGMQGKELLEFQFASDRHYDMLMKFYKSVVKKKILLVNNFFYNRGGDCTYLMALKGLLEKKGHRTLVFSMQHPNNYNSRWSKYFVNYINYDEEVKKISLRSGLRVASRTIYFFKAKRMIERLIREEKPEIAHLQNIHHHITPSILYTLKKYNIPVFWTLHDYQLICPNISFLAHGKICERCKKMKYYSPALVRCKKGSFAASLMASIEIVMHRIMGIDRMIKMYVSPSNFLRNKFIEYGFDKKKIEQIPHFADEESQNESTQSDDYYLYLGRITEEKGLKTLIDAAIKVNSGKLKIVGNGPMHEEIMQYAEAKDTNGTIEFLGHQTRDKVYDMIRKCIFLVIPSEWYENFPFSVLEAFASSKPVIGSRMGGIPELIKNNERGLLFKCGDSDDLCEKIRYMLKNPDETKRMGRNARIFIEKEINAERHYEQLMSLYEST